MPPKLKTEIVEPSMFIFLPDRLLLVVKFLDTPQNFFSQRAFFSTLLVTCTRKSVGQEFGKVKMAKVGMTERNRLRGLTRR